MSKLFFITFILSVSLTACNSNNKKTLSKQAIIDSGFVYMNNNKMELKGKEFFPLMLNYIIEPRFYKNELVIAPLHDYFPNDFYKGKNKDSINYYLNGHLTLIKELGFNSIRLVINGLYYDQDSEKIFFKVGNEYGKYDNVELDQYADTFISQLSIMIDFCKKQNLKIMILFTKPSEIKNIDKSRIKFIKKVLESFKSNTTIFAYDFFNEPLFFDKTELPPDKRARAKEDVLSMVEEWRDLMIQYAPYQLLTIGLAEPIEVFNWDPSILPVDFLSFHTYHPLRVPNEIYWYAKYSGKPWMIGETSLPADNDSVSYAYQTNFLRQSYERTINCGGIGYGWWGFQDVSWGGFEHDFTPILNRKAYTWTSDSAYKIFGSLKPAALELKNLRKIKNNNRCDCWVNYFNLLGYKNMVIEGSIVGENNQPIEGAVIRGWNRHWSIGANTFSDSTGKFTLYSNTPFEHFVISASGYKTIKFDQKIEYKAISENELPIDSLKNQELEYQKIRFEPFLKEVLDEKNEHGFDVFSFDSTKFKQAKYAGQMTNQKLFKIYF